jgi:RNA polymerase sigma-70 factor (ECF subfamily)
VQIAIDGLKDEYRDVLRLRYFDGLSVAATAERMGRTEPAVHMLCHRAVAQLRDVLGSASRYFTRKQ